MPKIAIVVAMWVFGGLCTLIMKKIEPGNKIYPLWALLVSIMFSLFAIYSGFS